MQTHTQPQSRTQRRLHTHFTLYPHSRVYGVFDDLTEVRDLTQRLVHLGFGDERVVILQGEDGIRELDPEGRHHGLIVRLVRALQGITDEREHIDRYVRRLLRGQTVVAVSVPNRQDVIDRLARIFHESGGHDVHFYGPFVVQRLGA